MNSEIEEIVGFNDKPHHDNTKKNDNYSNDSTDHRNGDINDNRDGDMGEDKKEDQKEDGRKGTSTKVLCYPLRLARSMITTRREKSNKSVHRVDNSADPPDSEFDEHLPNSLPPYQSQSISLPIEFRQRFENLEPLEQKCLSTFILFPENTVVKKMQLVYLWIGEGFFDDSRIQGKTLEESATGILNKLMEKKLVLQVKKNCQDVVNSFMMDPDVYSQLHSSSEGKVFQDEVYSFKNSEPLIQEKVKTLFNISQGSLDFKLEQSTKMKNVKILYLGRWQSSAERHHIEVADSEFLKGLKNMENLRFLSLRGISGIQELPRSISNLRNLRILDLRACYNLEKLPKEIASLKKLTHLDISECYLLDCMPRELLSLSELQVLKGFVISDTKNSIFCTLAELAGLKKLTKLSVNLNSVNFSIDNFSAVPKFDKLQKLKITWGGKFSNVNRYKKSKQENGEAKSKATEDDIKRSLSRLKSAVGEVNLEKLELQCLPHKTLPNWVNPDILKKLKKLYIRGGGLKTLSRIQEGGQKWKVDALRLKYLNEFNMNWIKLMAMFQDLQYFEKFKCPKLTLCPCDFTGVWTKELPPQPQTS